MKPDREERYRALGQMGQYLAIPFLLLVSPLIGLFIGQFLDRRFATSPVFMIIFIALGFVAGGREVYRIVRRVARDEERARKRRRTKESEGRDQGVP